MTVGGKEGFRWFRNKFEETLLGFLILIFAFTVNVTNNRNASSAISGFLRDKTMGNNIYLTQGIIDSFPRISN